MIPEILNLEINLDIKKCMQKVPNYKQNEILFIQIHLLFCLLFNRQVKLFYLKSLRALFTKLLIPGLIHEFCNPLDD